LNFVFALNKQVEQLIRVQNGFTIVCHQTNQGRVPLVRNLGKSRGTACHQNLTHSVFKLFNSIFVNLNERLSSDFLRAFILQLPDTVFL
jgi:hypothetical protein